MHNDNLKKYEDVRHKEDDNNNNSSGKSHAWFSIFFILLEL